MNEDAARNTRGGGQGVVAEAPPLLRERESALKGAAIRGHGANTPVDALRGSLGEQAVDWLLLLLEAQLLFQSEEVVLPGAHGFQYHDEARGIDLHAIIEGLLNDSPRREPGGFDFHDIFGELGAGEGYGGLKPGLDVNVLLIPLWVQTADTGTQVGRASELRRGRGLVLRNPVVQAIKGLHKVLVDFPVQEGKQRAPLLQLQNPPDNLLPKVPVK